MLIQNTYSFETFPDLFKIVGPETKAAVLVPPSYGENFPPFKGLLLAPKSRHPPFWNNSSCRNFLKHIFSTTSSSYMSLNASVTINNSSTFFPESHISTTTSANYLGKYCARFFRHFISIYPPQRQNLLPTLEIITHNFQNFQKIQNFGKKFQNLEFFSKISKTTKGPPMTSKGPPPPY